MLYCVFLQGSLSFSVFDKIVQIFYAVADNKDSAVLKQS